jgi:hypothetical protein
VLSWDDEHLGKAQTAYHVLNIRNAARCSASCVCRFALIRTDCGCAF